jgi:hypothetical protein
VLLTAERRGIGVLGVVDHNTARNAPAFADAAQAFAVRVFVGLEVESAEGVHVLTLFDTVDAALDMDSVIAEHLPELPNRPNVLGTQWLLDEYGRVTGLDDRLLMGGTDLSVEAVAELSVARGGVSIPAHVDRSPHGLLPLLGFVPPGLRAHLLELSQHIRAADARRQWPDLDGRPLSTASDAHYLDDIGRATTGVPEPLARAALRCPQWIEAVARQLLTQRD